MFCKPSEWLSYVQEILRQNGFAYVWQSNGTCIDHTVFMRSLEQRIKDNFQQKCQINISNRCILYKAIDRKFEMAKYLLCVHINSNRKALCRLRLSSHRLLIELIEIEDEYHVMLICPRYTVLRKKYLKKYYIVKPSMYKFVTFYKISL